MGSGSTVRLALCEVLQLAALCVPLLVVSQRFAAVVAAAEAPGEGRAAYWLIVASALAYVTTATLLLWLPLKYMVFAKKGLLVGRGKWRPVALVYVILSTLPCFSFLIASSEVQIRANIRYDTFTELPVSLVVFSLICIDVVERIRQCSLPGQDSEVARDSENPSVERVTTVTPVPRPGAAGPVWPPHPAPSVPGVAPPFHWRDLNGMPDVGRPDIRGHTSPTGRPFALPGYRAAPVAGGPLRTLCVGEDARADVFADSFLFWMDTVEMVRTAGHPAVFFSGWAFPVYLCSLLSCLRVVATPCSPALSALGLALQDLPFLVLRLGLLALFGSVTPPLYVMKNLLVCLAFIFFTCLTRLKV